MHFYCLLIYCNFLVDFTLILPQLINNWFSNTMKLFSRLSFSMVNSYNAHTILGITRMASQKQIKTAYYKLAKQYHPDNNPKNQSTDMFHKITKAYEILIDEARNNGKRYHSDNKSNDFHQNEGKSWSDDEDMFKAYQNFKKKKNVRSDSFHKFMEFYQEYISGAKKTQKQKQKGKQSPKKNQDFEDEHEEEQQEQSQYFQEQNEKQKKYFKTKKLQIFMDIILTEQEAKSGVEKRIKYNKKIICIQCKGKPHKKQTICKRCNGSGMKMMKNSIGVCYQCGGNKTVQYGDCNGCHGKSFFVKHAQEFVHIRSGVAHNDEIFVNGKGHQNQKNGYFGDLVIKIKINGQRQQMDSNGIKKVGFNTFHTVKVSVFDAVLGADIRYKTLWGEKSIYLKSGTQDGAVIKRVGQGSRRSHHLSGDHYITINIQIPKEITFEQEKIYKRIREIHRSKFPNL